MKLHFILFGCRKNQQANDSNKRENKIKITRIPKVHFRPIVDRIKVKLVVWKGLLLSIMGRVQLAKSVISIMLVYPFHVYPWPISLLKQLNKMFKKIIWPISLLKKLF